jgi:hypothetical protein
MDSLPPLKGSFKPSWLEWLLCGNHALQFATAANDRNPSFVQKYCLAAIGNMGSLLPFAAPSTKVRKGPEATKTLTACRRTSEENLEPVAGSTKGHFVPTGVIR